jgi:hypothetical protein
MNMRLYVPTALIAVVAAPIVLYAAQAPTRGGPGYASKKTCEVNVPTGSRLGAVRRCRTQREREEAKQEARQVVDRIQYMKPTICTENRPC